MNDRAVMSLAGLLRLEGFGRFLVMCGVALILFSLTCSGKGDSTPNASDLQGLGEGNQTPLAEGPGHLVEHELGFSLSFPTEWMGEDSELSGTGVNYAQGRDWTVHTFTRQEGEQAYLGEGPSLVVVVVTSETDSGRKAIMEYYATLSGLGKGKATKTYDVIANTITTMMEINSDGSVVLDSQRIEEAGPGYAARTYYKLSGERLYVVGYVRANPEELNVDEPLIREIFSSFAIHD